MRFRALGRWVLILLSAWFVAAAFLWIETPDGPADIVQAVGLGAPAWMLAVPLIGIVCLAVLARAKPGAYWLLVLLAWAQVLVLAASMSTLQQMGIPPNWGPALSIPAALISMLVALAMAFGDAPPLNAPIARLVYLGRRKHLLDMQRLAERWGWQARGPEPRNLALRITGEWAGREVHLESGAVYRFSSSAASYYYLSVAVRSRKNLWPVALAIGMEGPKASLRKKAAKRKVRDAKGRTKTFYVWPPAGRPAGDVDAAALIAALESGKEFLRNRTSVNAAGESVWFGRQSSFTISETAEDVEAIIRWLDAIAGVMEKQYAEGETIRE